MLLYISSPSLFFLSALFTESKPDLPIALSLFHPFPPYSTHPALLLNLHKWSSKILSAQGLSSLLPRDKFRAVRIGTVEQVSASLSGLEGSKKVARFRDGEGLDKTGRGDREFYQSLVRDVIERKGSGGGLGGELRRPFFPSLPACSFLDSS